MWKALQIQNETSRNIANIYTYLLICMYKIFCYVYKKGIETYVHIYTNININLNRNRKYKYKFKYKYKYKTKFKYKYKYNTINMIKRYIHYVHCSYI